MSWVDRLKEMVDQELDILIGPTKSAEPSPAPNSDASKTPTSGASKIGETKQTEPPLAKGLDDWWQKELTAADAAAREKEAKAAGERAANRFWHVVHFGKDPGGWAQPRGGGRQIDWTKMPPGRDEHRPAASMLCGYSHLPVHVNASPWGFAR